MIKEPKILILDDATSELYERTEKVEQAIDRAMVGRTTLFISSKMSIVKRCDLLFVMNNG